MRILEVLFGTVLGLIALYLLVRSPMTSQVISSLAQGGAQVIQALQGR